MHQIPVRGGGGSIEDDACVLYFVYLLYYSSHAMVCAGFEYFSLEQERRVVACFLPSFEFGMAWMVVGASSSKKSFASSLSLCLKSLGRATSRNNNHRTLYSPLAILTTFYSLARSLFKYYCALVQ